MKKTRSAAAAAPSATVSPAVSNLAAASEQALLYKKLATLRRDVPIAHSFDDLQYDGPDPDLVAFCDRLGFPLSIP